MYGLDRLFPRLQTPPRETVIAVNVGGCIIPFGIAVYELNYLAHHNPDLLGRTAIASLVTTVVCYMLARPVTGLGIAMPAFAAPLASVGAALLLAPAAAPPVAFVAGVVGPLVGADLLHLRDCPSSGALRQFDAFVKGGSGSVSVSG
jgi:uncharacterized membrane protein